MQQLDGPSSMIAFLIILVAALLAECIPVAFALIGIAMLGIAFDVIRSNKKRPVQSANRTRHANKNIQPHNTPFSMEVSR